MKPLIVNFDESVTFPALLINEDAADIIEKRVAEMVAAAREFDKVDHLKELFEMLSDQFSGAKTHSVVVCDFYKLSLVIYHQFPNNRNDYVVGMIWNDNAKEWSLNS